MELTERQTIKITKLQKNTLQILREKYKINTSQFIRSAIEEKLEREKNSIFAKQKEINKHLKQLKQCPF